jgi:hypothetical protein
MKQTGKERLRVVDDSGEERIAAARDDCGEKRPRFCVGEVGPGDRTPRPSGVVPGKDREDHIE